MNLLELINSNQTVTLEQLKDDSELVLDIQFKLHELGLYPGGTWLDGDYGNQTEKGLKKFCEVMQLDNMVREQFDVTFAQKLANTNATDFRLETARNKEDLFQDFAGSQPNTGGAKFINQTINRSPFKTEIDNYPQRLKEKPDDIEVTSVGNLPIFATYPHRGQKGTIDHQGLNFLHSDIKQACVCIGSFVDGNIKAHWLGKNALDNVEFWSATKIIPILNVVSQANSRFPLIDIDNCRIRSQGGTGGHRFNQLVVGTVSYNFNPSSSNRLGAMFKRFSTYAGLEQWLKNITGNQQLDFRGRYGETAFINFPELVHSSTGEVLLSPASETNRGPNSISAYDLTRLITMLGWHYHIPQNARLPGAQWNSLESVVRGMGHDVARYVDAAIERLGLQDVIKSPVIISKTGWGRSNIRDRYEITYTAFVQFIDRRPQSAGNAAKLRSVAMTLLAAKDLNNAVREERELDTRMATEVTDILRRVVTEELV